MISFCSGSLLVETISLLKPSITYHDLWWDFEPCKPLHCLPEQYLILSTLLDFLLFTLITGTIGLLSSWESLTIKLFATITLALHLQTYLPSDIKSILPQKRTVKYKKPGEYQSLIRFYH